MTRWLTRPRQKRRENIPSYDVSPPFYIIKYIIKTKLTRKVKLEHTSERKQHLMCTLSLNLAHLLTWRRAGFNDLYTYTKTASLDKCGPLICSYLSLKGDPSSLDHSFSSMKDDLSMCDDALLPSRKIIGDRGGPASMKENICQVSSLLEKGLQGSSLLSGAF